MFTSIVILYLFLYINNFKDIGMFKYYVPLIYSELYNTDNAIAFCASFVLIISSLLSLSSKVFIIAISGILKILIINLNFVNIKSNIK